MLSTALTYDPSQQELSLLIVIGGITALLVVANLATQIWDRFRKKPSHSDELNSYRAEAGRTYATKTELYGVENRISDLISTYRSDSRAHQIKVESDVAELRRLTDQGFKEMQRTVGRLEGKLEK